jgi:succinate dehydrogenase/fumarate reductase flavoprotein subunit
MGKRIKSLGGTVLLDARGRSLLTRDGAVAGIQVEQDGRVLAVQSKTVILALGGFQAEPELLVKYLGPGAAEALQRSVGENRGDGLEMALKAGGREAASMDTIYGHFLPAPPCVLDWKVPLDPLIVSAYYAAHGIVLNVNGDRFVDEGAGENNGVTANVALQQPLGGMWIVMDNAVRRRYGRYELPWAVVNPSNLRYWRYLRFMALRRHGRKLEVTIDSFGIARAKGATILQAATMEDLTRQLASHGVDGSKALSTIADFNAAVDSGNTDELAVPKTKSVNRLDTAPFYAIKVAVGVSMTYGGVVINERAEVLDEHDSAIAGLYAVPGTAGGIHHVYYGGALPACGVYGMIAGDNAAEYASSH